MSKLDLKVCRGAGYDDNSKYSVNLQITNTDTNSVSLSAVRVVGYLWSQSRLASETIVSGGVGNGTIQPFTIMPNPNYSGVGQTGIVNLNTSSYVYRVNHEVIDSSKLAPIITLNIPSNNSYIAPISIINRTDYYFDIVLTELPPNVGYSVTWFIPYTQEVYSGSTTAAPAPALSFLSAAEYVRVDSRRCDTKFIISWNSSLSIPSNCGLSGTEIFISPTSGYFNSSSKPSEYWYSKLESALDNNLHFVLQEFVDGAWVDVNEETDVGRGMPGYHPNIVNQIKLEPTSTSGANQGVYISDGESNPVAVNSVDKNLLQIKSSSSTTTRSLLKFDLGGIPTSATSIRNAILRLNVLETSGAWNYSANDGHVSVHRITKAWEESQATWSNATSSTTWSSVGGDYDSEAHVWLGNVNLNENFTSAQNNKHFWIDVNVSDIVEYWRLNPTENHGFLIKLHPSSNETSVAPIVYKMNSSRFSSSGTPTGKPQLLIAYNVANPIGPVPNIEIKKPLENSNLFSNTVVVNAESSVSGGSITDVEVYYKNNSQDVFAGNLTNNGDLWSGSITFPSGSNIIQFFAKAESDQGVYGFSELVTIVLVDAPTLTITTSGIVCNDGVVTFAGTVSNTSATGKITVSGTFLPISAVVVDMVEDVNNSDVLWVATENDGLWRFDSTTNIWKSYFQDIPYKNLTCLGMNSNGMAFIGLSNRYWSGLIRFDTTKWNSVSSNDWIYYNTTNSIFSNFGEGVEVNNIAVDDNDNMWFSLSWSAANNILKIVGNNFNDPFVTSYSTPVNEYITSLKHNNSNLVVGTELNVCIYSSATDEFVKVPTPTIPDVVDVDVDVYGNIYVGSTSGLGYYNTTTSAWQYANPDNTPSWPNGLNSSSTALKNLQCSYVFADGSDKYFGFGKGVNGAFNGGLLKFTGIDFSASQVSANWVVYDTKTYKSFPDDNIKCILKTNSNIWVATQSGMSKYNGANWGSYNYNYIDSNITVGDVWTSNYSNLPFNENARYIAKFDYEYDSVSADFYVVSSRKPVITKTHPSNNISVINTREVTKLFEFDIGGVDFYHGDTATYSLYKSIDSVTWNLVEVSEVVKNVEVYDSLQMGQRIYYKLSVTTSKGCSAESEIYMAYGNQTPNVSLFVSPAPYSNTSPLTIFGRFYEPDFGTDVNDYVTTISAYTSSTTIGLGTIKTYQNFTSGSWEYVWQNPMSGTSVISATVFDSFGGSSTTSTILASAVRKAPEVTLITPPAEGMYSLQNTNITLIGNITNSSAVPSAEFFITNGVVTTSVGVGTNIGDVWSKTINVSAELEIFNNVGGVYDIFLTATDVYGSSATSNLHSISANNIPTFTLTNPMGPACHDGTIPVTGLVLDADGNSNCVVKIVSANEVITSAISVDGSFIWNWNSPPSGIHNLSAVVYDAVSATDFSITPFVISAGTTPILNVINNFPFGKKTGTVITPKINVVSAGNVLVSASVISSEVTYMDIWNSDEYGNKLSLISASVPNNSAYIPTEYTGTLKYILIETRTIGGCLDYEILAFYVLGPTVELSNFSNCGSTIRINGSLFFDGVSGSNPYIDNTFIAKLYADNTYVTDLSLSQTNDSYAFNYLWSNPIDGTTNLNFICVNEYGNFIYNYPISSLTTGDVKNVIFPTNYSHNVSGIYIVPVSATNITISSSMDVFDVKETQFIIETDDSIEVLYSSTNTISFSIIKDKIYNIKSKVITNGGCEVYSEYITLIRTAFLSNIGTIESSNCAGDKLHISGIVAKAQFISSYGTSGNPYLFSTETITSAVVYDNFETPVYTISEISALSNNDFVTFDFDYYPVVGTSAFTLYTSSTLFGVDMKNKNTHPIQEATTSVLTSPTSGLYYPLMSYVDFSVSSSNTNISEIQYYMNNQLVNGNSALVTVPGIIEFYAKTTTTNGCYSYSTKVSSTVISYPVAFITNPVNNSYIMSGTPFNIDTLVSPSSFGQISAVEVYDGVTLIGNSSEISNNVWRITNNSNVSSLVAKIYDTTGLTALSPIVNVNMIEETISTISTTTSSYSVSANITISATGTTPNSATIVSTEVYEIVNGQLIYVGTTTNGTLTIPASLLTPGSHTLISKTTDNLGAYSYSEPITIIVTTVGLISYPTIIHINSVPESLVEEYGKTITSNFRISDMAYGILSATIGVVGGNISSLVSVNSNKIYDVAVEISASGNVTISAMNQLSNSATFTMNNCVFACDGRKINLTNYVPNHLAFDNNGQESEYITLTSFFEGYLNTLYQNLDQPCSLGVLEKTNRLRNLHDPDTMELDYIQFFANYLGYNVDVNKSELGGFISSPNSSAYNDGPDNNEVFIEYQKKALRFVVRNLPNWYSIKTTRNAIKTLLLSFGIFGDLLEVYTNDYVSDWVINNIPPGTYVSPEMTNDRFPTPHMYVSIDINNTSLENIYGSEQMLTSVYKSFEAIRPANVVFEGLVGQFKTESPEIYVSGRYQLEGNLFINKTIS